MNKLWERIGVPVLAALLALVGAGSVPWWWGKVFQAPAEKTIPILWSCGWGDQQDEAMGAQCPQADLLHFHLIAAKNEEDKKYCTSIDLKNELKKGEALVEEPVQLRFIGQRPGAKFEGHRPEALTATAIGTKVAICGYYSPSTTWQNTDTHYTLAYRTVGGPRPAEASAK